MKGLLSAILFVACCSLSANETSPKSTVTRLISYAQYGNGDVYVRLQETAATCSGGYFINQNSVGFKNTFSMLLAAYQTQTPLHIVGNEAVRWGGSSAVVCEIYSVNYQ